MKARFNYDLTEVMSLLQEAQSKTEPEPMSLVDLGAPRHDRIHSERRELIERAEYLTTLMLQQREKARMAQSNLDITRALSLLKPS